MIEPVTLSQQQHVTELTAQYIHQASERYQQSFKIIPVLFDLKGRAAGMYRIKGRERTIRYNPYLFAKYFEDNLAGTIPHEVAHYITEKLYGLGRVRPHGHEWREVMRAFGVESSGSCHDYDLENVPVRRQRRFPYQCACTVHQISTHRHNKILNGKAHYLCRQCGDAIAFVH
jgi:SprT protein